MDAPSPIPQRPQHRDVHSDCWPGPSKYARCCVRLDAACFDGVLTHERCCGEAKQAKRVSWWGGQEVRSFAHLALFVIQQRLGCFPSASLDMASCCGSPASTHLGFDCWDGGFSRKHCCGHLSELSQIPLKPSECFVGSDYTFEKCCSTRDAGMLLGCWDFRFSYEKCCINKGAEAVSLVSVNNLTALLAAKSRGMCDRGLTLRHCQRHWRQVVAGVPALVSNKVGRYARHLAEYWRSRNLLEDVAQAAPGFAVSIALHAAAYILAEWRGGLHEPYFAFQHVATYLKLYREHVGRVDLKDMTSQAGGLRLADLDEAISILVQQSFPTSLDVAQRERIIDLHTRVSSSCFGDGHNPCSISRRRSGECEGIQRLRISEQTHAPKSKASWTRTIADGAEAEDIAGFLSNRLLKIVVSVHESRSPVKGKTLDLGLSPAMALACLSRWQRLNAALKVCSSSSQWQSALQQGGMAACAGIQENAATRTTLTSILRDVQRWQRVLLRFSRQWRSVSFDEIELRTVVGAVSQERSSWALVNALLCALQQDLLEPSSGLISSVLVNRDCWQVAILSSRSTNLILRTAVVGLCARTGQWTRSLSHVWQMRDIKFSLNDRTLVAAITAWKAAKRWPDAIGMLSSGGSLVQTAGANNIPYTAAMSACETCTAWWAAVSLLPSLAGRRVPTSSVTCNAVICAQRRSGEWSQNVALLECMKVMAFRPDMMTSSILLTGEGRLAWSAAIRLFNFMQWRGVRSTSWLSLRCAALARWRIMCSLLGKRWARDASEEQAGQLVDLCAEASWRLGAAMVVEAASFSLRPNLMTSTPIVAAAGRTGDWQMSLVFLAEASDRVDSVANCAAATSCTASTYWSHALGLLRSVPCTRLPLDIAGESATAMALEAGSAWQLLIQQIGQAAWLRGDIGFCCSVSGACEKASKWAKALWMATHFHWLRVSERIACNSCLTSCRRSGCWELTLRNWIGFEDGFQDILTLALGVDLLDKWDVVDNDAELMVFLEGTFWRDEGARISLELQARDWPPCLLQFYRKLVCISMSHGYPVKLEFYFFGKDIASGTISNSPDKEDVGRYPLQAWGGQMPMDIVYPFTTCRLGETGRPVKCPAKAMDLLYHWNSVEGVGEYVRDSRDALVNMPGKNGLPKEDWCIALPVVTQDRDFSDPRNSRLIEQGLNAEDLRLLEGYADALRRDGYASFAKHLQDGSCQRRQDSILRGDQFVGLAAGGGKVRDDNHPGFG
ncbi:unnamed protein product [Symbiodinium sp. CCMP2592]|nr:unnamed protein product [Symbiodinium sp. CCMP2592]